MHRPLAAIWPGTVWATQANRAVHLTFDDGPDPVVTPWVLAELGARGMSATFFVVGDQAAKHGDVLRQVAESGHALGGHTMAHEHGWRTPTATYVQSARASLDVVAPHRRSGTPLFRPPYGKFTRAQASALAPRAKLVMWDVLSGDYAAKGPRGAVAVLRRLQRQTRPGSVVVFHDSAKCGDVLRQVLPAYLDWLAARGWTSCALDA